MEDIRQWPMHPRGAKGIRKKKKGPVLLFYLDLLKDPVTLPCGQSYCNSCIEGYWDQDEQKGVYSCPQCRQSLTLRPALKRNNMLAEVVEKLKETGGTQAVPSELTSPAGPGEVTCDLCTGPRNI